MSYNLEEERMKWFMKIKEVEDKDKKITIGNNEVKLKDFCIILRKAAAIHFSDRRHGYFVRRLGHLIYSLVNAGTDPIYISQSQWSRLKGLQVKTGRLVIVHR